MDHLVFVICDVTPAAPRKRAFRLGHRRTKRLAHDASEDVSYTFHLVGKVKWGADTLKAANAKGVFDVKLAKTFSGG